jgi:hypothetical protein
MKLSVARFAVALLAVGIAACAQSAPLFPESVTRTLQSPDRVESFGLDPAFAREGDEVLGRLEHWGIIEVGPELQPGEARRVARMLLDSGGYLDALDPRGRKLCGFSPRHALRFTRAGAAPVEVIICFACSQLRVRTADGAYSWFGNFDPMEGELKRRLQAVAPTLKL